MLGDRLKELRSSLGLTQDELSKKLNISRGTYAHYELNKREPNYEMLTTLASFFDVSLDYLMGVSDARNLQSSTPAVLTQKDEKDIAKDLDMLMHKIDSDEDSPLYYNGEELSMEDRELFKDALEFALKRIKVENKQKYTPKKYRK